MLLVEKYFNSSNIIDTWYLSMYKLQKMDYMYLNPRPKFYSEEFHLVTSVLFYRSKVEMQYL